jgi:subtilisin family serine protease
MSENIIKHKTSLFFLLIFLIANNLFAQDKYWVYFKDKAGVEFNPYKYFDIKAIERRQKAGISLYDSTDFPLNPKYVKGVEEITDKIEAQLRWFNAVLVSVSDTDLFKLKKLPYIRKIELLHPSEFITAGNYDTLLKTEDKKILEFQVNRMQGELFPKNGFTGKGIRIAVFDAGFPGVDEFSVFDHLRKNKQIIATWDFSRKKEDVYVSNPHGTMVLSCITGITDGRKMGMATDAEFLLARTEVEREIYMEEVYWLQAVEWADKNGADIINSSLAYTYERYYTFEMNGSTSLVSKAANLAANKGILVVNAMGNDGDTDWKILATPADADSVLSVGAINPITDFHAGFSSFGPTSTYKMKPNIVAPGRAIVAGKTKLEKQQGTSFAAPIVTGFAACAWQCMPYLTNMQLFEKLEQSGHLYPYFDYAHGYGVPQASFFIEQGKAAKGEATFTFSLVNDTLYIEVDPKYIDKNFLKSNNYLYYHIENSHGYLDNYWLIDVFSKKAAFIDLKEYQGAKVIRAHYKGFTNEYQLD